jgi:carboxynorspermidine decarboxylase
VIPYEPGPALDPHLFADLQTPAYVVDLAALDRNLAVLADVQERAQCKILLALKGFAMWSVFPRIAQVLAGVATSSPAEAHLGREKFGKEVHAYAPAYSPADIEELLPVIDHLVFNSVGQWRRYAERVASSGRKIDLGLRVNLEHSEVSVALYDPSAPCSRMGTTLANLQAQCPHGIAGLDGLHFHNLCELGADALVRSLAVFEEKFGPYIPGLKWVNFGGGHHITRPDYDVEQLIRVITDFRKRWGVAVYLEPGEAIALNTGVLVTSVLDIVNNGMDILMLDTSATAHMPDVLEMPYRPRIVGGAAAGEKKYTYRLGGQTCLSGDIIGDWSFDQPLQIGDKLVFCDMAHYTMVKNSTFNGVRLPSIATIDTRKSENPAASIQVVRSFGYEDYKNRLS